VLFVLCCRGGSSSLPDACAQISNVTKMVAVRIFSFGCTGTSSFLTERSQQHSLPTKKIPYISANKGLQIMPHGHTNMPKNRQLEMSEICPLNFDMNIECQFPKKKVAMQWDRSF
jgi:hypothetical protein